jgi:hypothetical protein
MAQDIFQPWKSGFGITQLQTEYYREQTTNDGPNYTCYQELFCNHFMILAENVFGYKRFMMMMFMMCIMTSVNICLV